MRHRRPPALCLIPAMAAIILTPALGAQQETLPVHVVGGQTLFELVGQVTNPTATTSTQYGYFTWIKDLTGLFTAAPENETTALFTFYRTGTNVHTAVNGPLRIVTRVGTTTVYRNASAGASFADPESFHAGTPILVATFRQQVVVNTANTVFTVVNVETVTATSSFQHDGRTYRIGKVGDMYRTIKTGHSNSPAPPNGYFGGYSIGIERGSARRLATLESLEGLD